MRDQIALPDGDLILVGQQNADTAGAVAQMLLARLRPDGTLEPSFGENGYSRMRIGGNLTVARAVVLRNDNRLLVVASVYDGQTNELALVQFDDSGHIDANYGTEGVAMTGIRFIGFDTPADVQLLPDGRLIMVGWLDMQPLTASFAWCLHLDGTRDPTFGNNGEAQLSIDYPQSIAIHPSGKLIIAGSAVAEDGPYMGITQLNFDGTPDASFANGGAFRHRIGSGENGFDNYLQDVKVQSNGQIVAGGYASRGGDIDSRDFTLLRLNAEGNLDQTFGDGGVVLLDFEGGADHVESIEVMPDDKIIAVGYARRSRPNYDFALARFNEDGSTDQSFGVGGKVKTDFGDVESASMSVQDRLKRVLAIGGSSSSVIVAAYHASSTVSSTEAGDLPSWARLKGSYPNPFNPTTILVFDLPRSGNVRLSIHDSMGREIDTVLDQVVAAGQHEARWEGRQLASGVYFARLVFESETFVQAIVYAK